jgi:hypothetical protein
MRRLRERGTPSWTGRSPAGRCLTVRQLLICQEHPAEVAVVDFGDDR